MKIPNTSLVAALLTASALASVPAPSALADAAQGSPFMGQVKTFAFNFCPRGWLEANGQILPINDYTQMYAYMYAVYGGDGRTTFAMPDLRARFTSSVGTGTGLTPVVRGQSYGTADVTLALAQMPRHTHSFQATSTQGDSQDPDGRTVATFASAAAYAPAGASDVVMNQYTVGNIGAARAISVQDPYIALTMCINYDGEFPLRG